jgi:hypothetical protein
MALLSLYRINSPPIIYQTVENEVIIINLENGSYYSLSGSGAKIWSLLENELDTATIRAELSRCYRRPVAEIETSLELFFDQLVRDSLIEAVARPGSPGREATNARLSLEAEDEYRQPELESFTDLQNLLLLDPIHQVGPRGWPRRS